MQLALKGADRDECAIGREHLCVGSVEDGFGKINTNTHTMSHASHLLICEMHGKHLRERRSG